MNKYTELSDFEINLKVAHIVLGNDNYDWCPHSKMVKKYVIDDKGLCMDYAPCNNPSDAMPIIVDNKICMNYIEGEIGWCAYHFDEEKGELEIYGKNYYRVAMICFLLMKDAENEINNKR
ncbi:phage protein NinX family protein [Providencia rettgeri]|uniref:phage protein NinX family protein n=1 Tax=Providencia rettgeri TaxID=587 RepID=UPI001B368E83|nr:phage protein NinX family protein [Providencia rettgeri]MBQ0315701.1 DUF2591 family protein [Providencia rettgeri]MBQ0322055.1 DUF2591 family protein [Providencia rettgeri]MBQ0348693.1 DUF2591 family protein [Providencia rettgeri]MBQ0404736.1 DUF2591 family protein [Providencia rettgeri]MCJ2225632.1 DUF2591 domain-containing protein [Providencia rettgeri]